MRDMPLVLDLQTAMSVAEIVQPHREPTHPAVIPRRFGKGERLAHLALITQATGPVVSWDHHNPAVGTIRERLPGRFDASLTELHVL